MSVEILRIIHVASVATSVMLFVVRFLLLNIRPHAPLAKPLKVFPHIVDTVLLVSAISLVVKLGVNPFATDWLLAKIIALIAYIAIGVVCFRATPASPTQRFAFVGALIVFAYIVAVAVSKQPIPY